MHMLQQQLPPVTVVIHAVKCKRQPIVILLRSPISHFQSKPYVYIEHYSFHSIITCISTLNNDAKKHKALVFCFNNVKCRYSQYFI